MFIVHESKGNHLEPHRGGMMASGAGHAALTELERILGCGVTINMSLLRSWGRLGRRSNSKPARPNPASSADGGITSLVNSGRFGPAAP